MIKQLHFQFQNETNSYLEEDFLKLVENSVARKFLDRFFSQQDFANSKIQSLILKGPKASGKTHLLNIFSRKFAVKFLDKEKIFSSNLANSFAKNCFYILEDSHEVKDEEGLLRLINSAYEVGAFLLMSSLETQKFRLKDLNSRLKNILIAEIENPSDEAIEQLLVNRLARGQIRLSQREIKSILQQISRSYSSVDDYLLRP